jgi:hypothetical protein
MANIGSGVRDFELHVAHAGVDEATASPERDVEHHNLAGLIATFVVRRLVPSGLG